MTRQEQQAIIEKQAVSGQTQVAYCDSHGISLSRFRQWKYRKTPKAQPPTFVELVANTFPNIELVCGRFTLKLPVGFDRTQLRAILEVLP